LRGPLRKRESHLWLRDANDWYVEPAWCSERLFEAEDFSPGIIDPACGIGTILKSARAAGLMAYGSDIIDRAGVCFATMDFLDRDDDDRQGPGHIVCNPPFGKALEFVTLALERTRDKTAMLLPANWVQGDKRARWLATTPLKRVWFLAPRPSMPPGAVLAAGMRPGNGTTDYAWFVWERGHIGAPTIGWLHRDGAPA
jgi:hypothetical protein